ncbi:MAG: metallophosphoesterase [Methanomicrobiales archaeon]|nr:metallophosphoesterase [Methanomicrobiales archaeon]
MMSVLLIADLHGQFEKMDAFLALEPEMILISGDVTHFGPVENTVSLLQRIDLPCFVVPGNCDPPDLLNLLEESSAVSLHGSALTLGNISLAGVGGSNPTPFNSLFELSEDEIGHVLAQAMSVMDRSMHNVLITHAPPFGALDFIGGKNVGSHSIRSHTKDFDLVCCAHIHEQRGIAELEGTKVVNPGVASEGNCAMIHFGDRPKEIRIELLTV